MKRIALATFLMLAPLAAAAADGVPQKIPLPMRKAVEMALMNNADLRVESLSYVMSTEDVNRSRGIYDPFLLMSINHSSTYFVTEDQRSRTDSPSGYAQLTQLLPTGGNISALYSTGFTETHPAITQAVPLYDKNGQPVLDPITQQPVYTIYRSGRNWHTEASVGLTHPLLRNAGFESTEASIILAVNALNDSLERYRSFAADTIQSVLISYNRLYTLKEVLASKRDSVDVAQRVLEETQKKAALGQATQLDLRNAEYGLIQRRKDLVDAERNVRDQEVSLRYYIGMTDRDEIIPIDPPSREEPPDSELQAVEKAMDLRPDLRQLRLALKATELQERLARNTTLPDLSLSATGGLTGDQGPPSYNLKQMGQGNGWWRAGLQFSMPLGNRAAEADYRRAKIRTEQVRKQIDALAWRIRNEVEADMRALVSARLQILASDKAAEAAAQRLEDFRVNYRAGKATTQDVLLAEADLSMARSSQLEAKQGFADAVTKLYRDSGQLLDRMKISIELPKNS